MKMQHEVQASGRNVAISHPDKVLFPQTGFTKADLVDYYLAIADDMLPHLIDRPLSVARYPSGVGKPGFVGKHAPAGRPDWVQTTVLPSSDGEVEYVVVSDAATLAWLGNLCAIELHTPQWTLETRRADRIIIDLDPGDGTTTADCLRVSLLVRDALIAAGMTGYPKTSGSKGIHIVCPIEPVEPMEAWEYAKTFAAELATAHPAEIVANMRKNLRHGKILVDWSQNNPAKTTVTTYSVRAKSTPTVSTPVSWAAIEELSELSFTTADVRKDIASIRRNDIYE